MAQHQPPFVTWYYLRRSHVLCLLVWRGWNYNCLGLLLIALSHPLAAPRGSQDRDRCSGSEAWNAGLDYQCDSQEEGGGGRPTFWNDSGIKSLGRRPCVSTHLPKTDVKDKSESEEKEAPQCRNSTNSLQSALTGEQTAVHDNTHRWWK